MAIVSVGVSLVSSNSDAKTTPIPLDRVQIFSLDSRARFPSSRQARHWTRGFGILFNMVSSGGTMPFEMACKN